MNRKKTIILVSILSYLVIVILGLTFNIIPFIKEKRQSKIEQASAKEIVKSIDETKKVDASAKVITSTSTPIPEKEFEVLLKYEEVKVKYPDVVGKVKIEDTDIDYMVVQTDNNEFYLDKDYDKNQSKSGAIYMDYNSIADELSDKLSGNIVLYGHNMKAGTMFHNLRYYMKEDYAKEHSIIEFDTLGEDLEWEVFSVYNESAQNGCIGNDTVFYGDNGYSAFLDEIKNKSKVDMGVSIENTDVILTLITCDYSFDDGRLFVHAKLKK